MKLLSSLYTISLCPFSKGSGKHSRGRGSLAIGSWVLSILLRPGLDVGGIQGDGATAAIVVVVVVASIVTPVVSAIVVVVAIVISSVESTVIPSVESTVAILALLQSSAERRSAMSDGSIGSGCQRQDGKEVLQLHVVLSAKEPWE